MSSFLDLPGELRNEIYYAVYNLDGAVHLTNEGHILVPSLAHVNTQIRRESLSTFKDFATNPRTIHAAVKDLDCSHLLTFIATRPSLHVLDPTRHRTMALNFHFTKPTSRMQYPDTLIAFLDLGLSDSFTAIKYAVDFNWRALDITVAHNIIQSLSDQLHGLRRRNASKGLIDGMVAARQAQVKRTLVERPARQRLQVSQGGRDWRHMRMD